MVFVVWQAVGGSSTPLASKFRTSREALGVLFPNSVHHRIDEPRDLGCRVMSRRRNFCGDKADLLYFD